jgi:hypothetical protein
MSKKFMPDQPVPPWRVGVWVSSADPRKHVVMVAVGEEEISEYGAHRDFVRWLTDAPDENVQAAERAAFEAHITLKFDTPDAGPFSAEEMFYRPDGGRYFKGWLESQWQGWQARAAHGVALPAKEQP